jgi:glycogen synthase
VHCSVQSVYNLISCIGGLGDVVGALPKALARRGHRVMVVFLPYLLLPPFLNIRCIVF